MAKGKTIKRVRVAAEPQCERWVQQRWLIDNTISALGVDFEQGRTAHILALAGDEAGPDVAAIRQRVKKYDDIAPAFEAAGRRREARAQALEKEGLLASASESYYLAAHFWASAQWPILVNDETNLYYNQRKRECYERYGRLADHRVLPVWIPFQGRKKLPAWLHLPPGYQKGRTPAVVALSGMDGYKERIVSLYGDRWLRRGMAVLTVDGPGQYESAVLGIPVSVPAWLEAGQAMFESLAARPEIDAKKIGITGRSFGSLFATLSAAGESRYQGCAVSGTCLEPGCGTLFGEAPPTFKRRFMYMSGYTDETKFDRFAKTLTWEGHAEKIKAAYLCVTGEFDALSPLAHTERMMKALRCPKQLLIYQGAGHSASGTPSTALGPFYPTYMADWMNARFAGEKFKSERWFVDHAGRIEHAPYR